MITGTQSRMARAALGWSLDQLSDVTGYSRGAIIHFENNDGYGTKKSTIAAIRTTFEHQGIDFIEQHGVSSQAPDTAHLFTSEKVEHRIWQDILATWNNEGGDVFMLHDPDKPLGETGECLTIEYIQHHFTKGVAEELLAPYQDKIASQAVSWHCHWIGGDEKMFSPMIAFGKDKMVFSLYSAGGVWCRSPDLYDVVHRQFE